MSSENTIEELKSITGMLDFKNLSQEDAKKVLKIIGEQRLSEAQVGALVKIAPEFLSCTTEALSGLKVSAEGAKENQKEALAAITQSIGSISSVLKLLAEQSESDETREKIASHLIEAGKLYIQFAEIAKEMNSENNSFWLKMGGIFGTVALVVLGGMAMNNKDGGSGKA